MSPVLFRNISSTTLFITYCAITLVLRCQKVW